MKSEVKDLLRFFRKNLTENQIENLHHNIFEKGVRILCGEEASLFTSKDGGG